MFLQLLLIFVVHSINYTVSIKNEKRSYENSIIGVIIGEVYLHGTDIKIIQ